MSLFGPGETVNDLTEVKLLGYFETVKGNFILKLVFLLHFTDANGKLLANKLEQDKIDAVKADFPFDLVYTAIQNGNKELVANYLEDIVTSALISAWSVFEQLIKDLPTPGYALGTGDLSADYSRGMFALSQDEKRNLELFYYIRNAIVHYNGGYYAYKNIDRHYRGVHYHSVGHYGSKIVVNAKLAWAIILDTEQYALKCWTNWKHHNP